jgi:hypothetical protein
MFYYAYQLKVVQIKIESATLEVLVIQTKQLNYICAFVALLTACTLGLEIYEKANINID